MIESDLKTLVNRVSEKEFDAEMRSRNISARGREKLQKFLQVFGVDILTDLGEGSGSTSDDQEGNDTSRALKRVNNFNLYILIPIK